MQTCNHEVSGSLCPETLGSYMENEIMYRNEPPNSWWWVTTMVWHWVPGQEVAATHFWIRTMSFGWSTSVFTSFFSLKEVKLVFLEMMLTTGEQIVQGKDFSHFYTLEMEPWQTRTQNTWGKTESGYCLMKAAKELLSSRRTAYAFCDTVIRLIS